MSENHSGNKRGLFPLLARPGAYLLHKSIPAAHLFSSLTRSAITQSKKRNKKPSSSPQCCVFVLSPPPPTQVPSAVLFSVVRVRTLVIPEIPDCKIQKYFSARALIYRYVCITNMPLLFLHCRQRRERIALCCQINTLQIFISRVARRVPLTLPVGLNTKTRMMLHQDSGRFTNLTFEGFARLTSTLQQVCMKWGPILSPSCSDLRPTFSLQCKHVICHLSLAILKLCLS